MQSIPKGLGFRVWGLGFTEFGGERFADAVDARGEKNGAAGRRLPDQYPHTHQNRV